MSSIVVALRWGGAPHEAESLAAELRAAIERAAVSGARLVGVMADGASFGFDDEAMEEAIDLALAFVDHGSAEGNRWRVGIGIGDIAPVREEGAFTRLSVGPSVARAAALARVASGGEVLVDLASSEAASGALLAIGKRVANDAEGGGGKRFRALVLDVREPWRRDGAALARIRVPRILGRESTIAMLEAAEPGGLAIVRAPPGVGGTRLLEEIALRTERSLLLRPNGCSVEPLGALRSALLKNTRELGLGPREADLARALRTGIGIDLIGASDLVRAMLAAHGNRGGDRAVVLIDDASHVDRATLDAIGHAASVPDTPFAVVLRLDVGDPIPNSLASLVVEAEVPLKPLMPHEASAVLEDACGGATAVSAEVVKRWVRRGAGVPLAILESLRHGLAVGELAVRDDIIVPRSKTSGRGRTLSPHAWLTRRLAALGSDRAIDATITSLVALAGNGFDRRLVSEAGNDLGLPIGPTLEASIDRLVAEGVLISEGIGLLSPSSRTLREAAIERLDEATRRRLHAAIAAVLTRTAKGLEVAEGAHHAALAGDHLGAAALAMRASTRAQRAGLDEWATSFAEFARAEGGGGVPIPTTPAPPPRGASKNAPKPSVHPPVGPSAIDITMLEVDEDDLESSASGAVTIRTPPPDRGNRASLGVSNLTTGQIEALPSPGTPGAVRFLSSPPFEPPPMTEPDPLPVSGAPPPYHPESAEPPSFPGEPMPAPHRPPSSVPLSEVPTLARTARKALIAGDRPALESALEALQTTHVDSGAVMRLRGLCAVARGDLVEGVRLVHRARRQAKGEGDAARSSLACAIALGAAGRVDDALAEALFALASERRRSHGRASSAGDRACMGVIERLLASRA